MSGHLGKTLALTKVVPLTQLSHTFHSGDQGSLQVSSPVLPSESCLAQRWPSIRPIPLGGICLAARAGLTSGRTDREAFRG